MFPVQRPRRLRALERMRSMMRETRLSSDQLIFPLFVSETAKKPEPIVSMPGQFRHTVDSLLPVCEQAAKTGIPAILLFGIPANKNEKGSEAWNDQGIVQQSIHAIKRQGFPLLVITDVCLCEYTSHGHCGVVQGEKILNDPTLTLLGKMAVSHAQAGADVIAPSDMMDGRVSVIRKALDENQFDDRPILSYAVKYASGFYGPFREAAASAPQFGDRRSHQMDPANRREALHEAQLDLDEGADILMVKPALAYLDVISAVREKFNVPIAAYAVSGEYAMIEAAAANGWIDRQRIILETLTSITRAGADMILTYHALEVAKWLTSAKN